MKIQSSAKKLFEKNVVNTLDKLFIHDKEVAFANIKAYCLLCDLISRDRLLDCKLPCDNFKEHNQNVKRIIVAIIQNYLNFIENSKGTYKKFIISDKMFDFTFKKINFMKAHLKYCDTVCKKILEYGSINETYEDYLFYKYYKFLPKDCKYCGKSVKVFLKKYCNRRCKNLKYFEIIFEKRFLIKDVNNMIKEFL